MLLSFDYIPPPTLSGLTTTSVPSGILLQWDTPVDSSLWATEIWQSATNDRSAALLQKTLVGTNTYTRKFSNIGAVTRYYWIRAKGIYGQSNGGWYPTSSTGGIVGTVGLANTLDVAVGAVSVVGFSQNNSSSYTSVATNLAIDSGGGDIVVLMAGTINSCINITSAGVSILLMTLSYTPTVGAPVSINFSACNIKDNAATGFVINTTSLYHLIPAAPTGSTTYTLTISYTTTSSGGSSGFVSNPTIQLIVLKR